MVNHGKTWFLVVFFLNGTMFFAMVKFRLGIIYCKLALLPPPLASLLPPPSLNSLLLLWSPLSPLPRILPRLALLILYTSTFPWWVAIGLDSWEVPPSVRLLGSHQPEWLKLWYHLIRPMVDTSFTLRSPPPGIYMFSLRKCWTYLIPHYVRYRITLNRCTLRKGKN